MRRYALPLLFILGLFLLVLPDAIVFYLIMPVPTSQQTDQIVLSHFLYHLLWYFRIAGLLVLSPALIHTWRSKGIFSKIFQSALVIIALLIVYVLGFRFMPENVFKEPNEKIFLSADKNNVPVNSYVLGIEIDGETKAYPLKIVGYHHKIQDSVGGKPVLVTFCTMCRTGMVYDPVFNGKHQEFRLVGAAFNNAVIEDLETGSWWYQSTGIAGAGPLKGTAMEIIPYSQVTLASWIRLHPNTLIMQPDPHFMKQYAKLKNYDLNVPAANSDPVKSRNFLPNSWVVGLIVNGKSKVILWNELTSKKVINDSVNDIPVLIALEPDGYSFHAWKRTIDSRELHFNLSSDTSLTDEETGSEWDLTGECVGGDFKGKKLTQVTSYQTYYHSWQRFYDGNNFGKPYSIDHNKQTSSPE